MTENSFFTESQLQLLNTTHDEKLKQALKDKIVSLIEGVDIYLLKDVLSTITANANPSMQVDKMPVIAFDSRRQRFL